MKVLVTSGGTKIKIDVVRSITNMSQGTFGSRIADEFYDNNHDVYFLGAKHSKHPYFTKFNKGLLTQPYVEYEFSYENKHTIMYETYDEYSERLLDLLNQYKFDVIVLAAAVSDYGITNYMHGKIRSQDNLQLNMKPLPKLISKVRDLQPDATICGFKLLVNSEHAQLVEACEKSIANNDVDLVVGNDLRDIKQDNHTLTIVEKGKKAFDIYTKAEYYLPKVVYDRCVKIKK